jgi:L-amino acid N-acyltransferase YncA
VDIAENLSIRPAALNDAEGVARIYNHYILNTVVTFEEEAVSADEMARRISEITSASLPWLVAEQAGRIVGYAYAGKWKPRHGYRFSVEITVYLDPEVTGHGFGFRLYESLFTELRSRSIRVAIGGIALPNAASVALHEKLGMRKVAHFEQVGVKFNQWLDVGYWQVSL